MRKPIWIGLLSLVAASFFCIASSCQAADTEIAEPAFGFSYFSSQASFQKIPSESLGSACLELAKKHFFIDGKVLPWLYLYGEYRNGNTRLTIVGRSDGTAIFVQRGESCVRIPTEAGRGFRFDVGHRSDLKPATIPI